MSGTKAIFDTNVLLYYLQSKVDFSNWGLTIDEVGISVITKIEYLVNSSLGLNDIFLFEELENEISIFYITNENNSLVKETIKIRKKYKLKLPDAIIAATAIVNDATLFSADDIFSKVFNLKFQLIKI